MALFSKFKTRSNLSNVVSKFDGKVCFFIYIVGVVWFLALAHNNLSSSTYFSENALLPGLVDSEFYHDFGAENHYTELSRLMSDRHASEDMYNIPTDWLTRKFRSLGLDTYVQNYTFKYPFGVYENRNSSGENVYAILRAPRTSGTEAIVLSVPFRPELSGHDATYPGIALMLGLAKAFRRHSYWAKDIIFLVTDNQELGIQAWLSSYHHTPNKYIKVGVLPGRSGSIQAAINLELSSKTIGRVDVKFEGVNGKLPNLDLINTVERMFNKEGLRISIQKRLKEYIANEWTRFLYSLKTMFTMMWHQAPGTPTGNHGFFHKYNIEAVTIHGMKAKNKKAFDFSDTGRAIEGIFRSLNNLLERFHQSFFFYLLPSPDRYVSIGVYMPPLGIMALPILIKVLSSWLKLSASPSSTESNDSKSKSEKLNEGENQKVGEPNDELKTDGENVQEDVAKQDQDPIDKLSHALILVMSASIGICSFYSADFFVRSASKFGIEPEEGLFLGFLIIHLLAIFYPYIFKWRVNSRSEQGVQLNRDVLVCLALLIFGISVGTISVMNISMAFIIAAVWVPVILINVATKSKILGLLKRLLILIASPITLLFIGGVVDQTIIHQNTRDDLLLVAKKAYVDVQDGLMLSAFQFYLFDNWTFPLLNILLLPLWSLFWLIACVDD